MFSKLQNYWRTSLPGAAAVFNWSLWGWEQRATSEPDSMLGQVGLLLALLFTGWFLGLIWADQTRPGSTLRRKLNRQKRIEPILHMRRSEGLFGRVGGVDNAFSTSVQMRERDVVFVMVCVKADLNKDFSAVQASYSLRIGSRAVAVGDIYSGELTRGRVESHIPISLICDRSDNSVFYLNNNDDAPTEENLVKVNRGDQIDISVTVAAKGIRPHARNFHINLRSDPFGRLNIRSPDGYEWYSITF